MKLKKLAAGACALALGVSMMAMPAFADATFGEAGGSDTRDLYATFNTTDAYCIDIVFSGGSMVYTRTWNTATKKFDYAEAPTTDFEVDVVNSSSKPINYSVTHTAEDGVIYTLTGGSVSGTVDVALDGKEPFGHADYTISGHPDWNTIPDTSTQVKFATFTATVSIVK